MRNLLGLFAVLATTNALLEFTDSFLYDMNDIKGTYNLPITFCDVGCRVYLTYLDDDQHLGDQDNGPMTLLNGDSNITFMELNKLTLDNGEKGYFDIPEGTEEFTWHNPNGNGAARPLALWIVLKNATNLDSVAVYEAANGAHIESSNRRVVLMSVAPFTVNAKFEGDYTLTVKPSPFDMLENPECEYVLKTDNTITKSISQPFSSPIISLLYDSKTKMTLDINFDFPVERSIDASGYLSSPGYIGCYNKTFFFRSESYNYGVSSINETFLVDGETKRHVSFYGDINTDEAGPVLLYDMDTGDEPLIIVGLQIDNTSLWEHEMDTSSFSLHWDDTHWRGNGSFMIRYEVDGTPAPVQTTVTTPKTVPTVPTVPTVSTVETTVVVDTTMSSTTVITPTTSVSSLKSLAIAVFAIVIALIL